MPLPARPIKLSNRAKKSFWSRMPPKVNGCMLWKGRIDNLGRARFGSKNLVAARVLWTLIVGDLRSDQCVLHSCDNPACVNIKHLSAGSHQQNMRQMVERGRKPEASRPRYNGLYESLDVQQKVKELRKQGMLVKEICKEVDLCIPTVLKILDQDPHVCGVCGREFQSAKAVGMHTVRTHRNSNHHKAAPK